MSEAAFDALLHGMGGTSVSILDNLGLQVKFVLTPRYALASKRLFWIPRWLRWAFPGRKREYEAAWREQQERFLTDVLNRIGASGEKGGE